MVTQSDGGGLVLVSGGIESAVCLALATRHGSKALALTFDYGQSNHAELAAAARVADAFACERLPVNLDLGTWGDSPLTGGTLPQRPAEGSQEGVPATYVAGRNLIFLAIAMGIAETRHLDAVYFGAAAHDANYPDCRQDFVAAFQQSANLALRRAQEGRPVAIRTPLIGFTKPLIIKAAVSLGVPLHLTWSCYRDTERPCQDCGACRLRAVGFAEAGVPDPALDG